MHKKFLFAFGLFIITAIIVPAAVDARYRYHSSNNWSSTKVAFNDPWKSTPTNTSSSQPATSTKPVIIIPVPSVPISSPVSSGEVSMQAYMTGYSYWDNTPAGTSEISNPVIHSQAGGTGTWSDPITLAVGHSILSGKDILDYPAGTKFYLPYLKKYVIVEDTCGDGNSPQNGPCHTGYRGNVWLDLYVDGKNVSRSASDSCMDNITGVHSIIKNPTADHVVMAGSLSESGCNQY